MKQIISKFWILVGLLILGIGANAQTNKKNIYVYMGDSVVFKAKASEVDSVALEEEKTVVSLYNRAGTKLYSAAYADVDSISYFMKTPVADLLDIKFTADGQASDVSDAQQNVIIEDPDGVLDVQWSDLYQTYEARFANTWAGNAESYIKIDYSINDWYKQRLADGHTMETLFKAHYTPPIQNAEAKWFSAMEAGGTGFLITTISGERQNEITFLPNVSPQPANNWIWTTSGVVPQPEVYYHVVGVWNKEEGKSYIYVNGELKNVVDAVGNFNFPPDLAAQWIGIGCDASAGGGASSGDWTIVTSRIYSKALNQYEAEALWDAVAPSVETPQADVLDIVFHKDGTAEDVSKMKNKVELVSADNPVTTYYNGNYGNYAAKMDNAWGQGSTLGDKPNAYKVNYADNQAFKDALADGHSLETIFKATYTGTIPNAEAKWFASHQGGGTGFLISTIDNNSGRQNEITFLPNVSTTGGSNWIWATSGVVPEPETYYHVVGVWNKEEGKAYVYLNGDLLGTTDAPGELSKGAGWFAIGGDAQNEVAEQAWIGDVVTARIYDAPLDIAHVRALWRQVEEQQASAAELVTNVSYLNNLSVLVGGNYSIKGEGFQAGDQIVFTALSAELTSATLDAQLTEDGVTVTLPTDFLSGRYLLSIKRGEQVQDVTPITLNVVETMPEGSKVIAHRGYWNTDGAAQNSIASVQNAIDNKFYGAEIDVYITQDDHLVVNHDPTINGINIENSNFDDIKDQVLSNGETISELKDILELFKDPAVTTKLIIEIKQHSNLERGIAAAEAAMQEVAFAETSEDVYLPDRVEYISFGLDICQAIADFDDAAKVAYLNGDKSPQELYDLGIKGLDYTLDRYTSNPTWIQEAKDLGLTTNVWTINDTNDMIKCNNLGIDFITTDNPVEAERIRNLYANPGE